MVLSVRRNPTQPLSSLVAWIIFFSLLLPCSHTQAVDEPMKTKPPVPTAATAAKLAKHIDLAVSYMVRNCGPDGKFRYLRHLDGRNYPADKYNLLRHAGAIYALGMAYKRQPDPEVLEAMKRAATYLQIFFGAAPGRDESIAVWSPLGKRRRALPHDRKQAKLGGAGLALVALCGMKQISGNDIELKCLQGLGRFIRFMQKPSGGFHSKYYSESGIDYSWTSLYYPGEAMLGLVMLHELDNDRTWIESALRGMNYLAIRRKDRTAPADHWALLATARMLPLLTMPECPVQTRENILMHARQICEVILAQQNLSHDRPHIFGSFLSDGRTCPTSIRLEGLLAARAVILRQERESDIIPRIDRALHAGIAFLSRAQVRDGVLAGGFPRRIKRAGPAQQAPQQMPFNNRDGEVRIDYVQHALSAMISYEKVFYPERRTR